MARTVDCDQLVELVTDYLEGALPWRIRRRVQRHLPACGGCRAYLEQIRETIRLTGRVTEATLPGELREALVAAFRGRGGTS